MELDSALKKLEKAYFDLLQKEHYTKISVSDIVSIAGVSRTTFYRHYTDIFDMHKKVADKLAGALIDECYNIIFSSNGEDCLEKVMDCFYKQEKYVKLISGENGSRYFFEAAFKKVSTSMLPPFVHLSEDQLFNLRFMTISAICSYIKDVLENREHNAKFILIYKKFLNFDDFSGGNYAQ